MIYTTAINGKTFSTELIWCTYAKNVFTQLYLLYLMPHSEPKYSMYKVVTLASPNYQHLHSLLLLFIFFQISCPVLRAIPLCEIWKRPKQLECWQQSHSNQSFNCYALLAYLDWNDTIWLKSDGFYVYNADVVAEEPRILSTKSAIKIKSAMPKCPEYFNSNIPFHIWSQHWIPGSREFTISPTASKLLQNPVQSTEKSFTWLWKHK